MTIPNQRQNRPQKTVTNNGLSTGGVGKQVELWVPAYQMLPDDTAYYEVKWKGYSETTLEPREVLLKDVPKMVNQFEKKNKITFYENTNKTTGEKNPAVSHVEIVFFMFEI